MKKGIFITTLIALAFTVISSCEKENKNETKISSYNDLESHNMGQNCMSCHKQGGAGEGWFTAAGTVYDSLKLNTYPNATVKLYTEPNGNGSLKQTIQVDGKGNFYTTNNIDFGSGLFPVVEGNTTTKYMNSSISMGQCNSCHGVTREKIWIK